MHNADMINSDFFALRLPAILGPDIVTGKNRLRECAFYC